MSCPYCGGYHGGFNGNPPQPTIKVSDPVPPDRLRSQLEAIITAGRSDPYDRDVLPDGDGKLWTGRVYGTDESDREVTAAFGRDGTTREGETMIALGHNSNWEFYASDSGAGQEKGHDHAGPQGYKDRGKYPE